MKSIPSTPIRQSTFVSRTVRIIAMTCVLLTVSAARAQMTIDWSTIDGGGAMNSTGGTFTLSGTIGQPDAASNPTLTGGTFELTGGFWPVSNVCFCLADMNHDGKKDGLDVQSFLGCMFSPGGDCSCADTNQAGGVTLADVSVFVNDLIAGSTCP